jgi:hypothetical protein
MKTSVKYKKIGFLYAKYYIDEKIIFSKLVNYAQSVDNNYKTYVIYDNQGLIHDFPKSCHLYAFPIAFTP